MLLAFKSEHPCMHSMLFPVQQTTITTTIIATTTTTTTAAKPYHIKMGLALCIYSYIYDVISFPHGGGAPCKILNLDSNSLTMQKSRDLAPKEKPGKSARNMPQNQLKKGPENAQTELHKITNMGSVLTWFLVHKTLFMHHFSPDGWRVMFHSN